MTFLNQSASFQLPIIESLSSQKSTILTFLNRLSNLDILLPIFIIKPHNMYIYL
ncbi:hypothetical protein KFK09_008644 [Dendrobium nobile]|uniref:Uncharacterized protein n=1 Tax=Dendrobium nobile TaxID=94219 RepID=A0A8T3BRF0_DENNO|nr:hypothetical protein KFK09_008644 [Dendrobium nobile]